VDCDLGPRSVTTGVSQGSVDAAWGANFTTGGPRSVTTGGPQGRAHQSPVPHTPRSLSVELDWSYRDVLLDQSR